MLINHHPPVFPCPLMFACLVSGSSVNTDCKQVETDKFLFDNLAIKPPSQHLALFTTPAFPSSAWPSGYSAAIYLQFKEDVTGEWRYLGAIGEGKESAFFKVHVPESISNRFETLSASIGISILPTINLSNQFGSLIVKTPTPTAMPLAKDSLTVAKKLLDNFVNYALSYSRTFTVDSGNEAYIPAKIITDWYNNTVRKAQMDPIGFFNKLMRNDNE